MKQMFGNCFQQLHNTRIEKKQAWHLETNAAVNRSERTSYNNKSRIYKGLRPVLNKDRVDKNIRQLYIFCYITSNRRDIYMIGKNRTAYRAQLFKALLA